MAGVLPAVRFAVEAYVHFAGERTTLEGIASSLTELFAPQIHEERISGMLANYDFISDNVMQYFRRRLVEAPKDVAFALDYVRREARTAEQQQAVLDALRFKCDVLWAQLDAVHFAYVEPGQIAPGAFIPADRR
jgi:pyrroloquinoline-quinone synthase